MRERFDLEALDPDDPFELDSGNLPHLAKHAPFTAEDALDAWAFGDPLFYPAAEDGPADWLMVARVPGSDRRRAARAAAKRRPAQVSPDRNLRAEPSRSRSATRQDSRQ